MEKSLQRRNADRCQSSQKQKSEKTNVRLPKSYLVPLRCGRGCTRSATKSDFSLDKSLKYDIIRKRSIVQLSHKLFFHFRFVSELCNLTNTEIKLIENREESFAMDEQIHFAFQNLANIFQIPGEIRQISAVNQGHINSTYDVLMETEERKHRFIFQKINSHVFRNPEKIMQNIELITTHIAEKLERQGKSRDGVMHFAHKADGSNFHIVQDGFWRISEFVPNTTTVNTVPDRDMLRSAGAAFGEFQTYLADFDASRLYETIPNFHNTRLRLESLLQHAEEDPCNRAAEVAAELETIRSFAKEAVALTELVESDAIPLRVTHNDTKINNILFDRDTMQAKTVIDLDTVMPGLVAYDFGDAIRFAANKAAEDEPDLSKVGIDLELFRAFAEGFVPMLADTLTETEQQTLALGAFVMTAEVGIRFLDDYISGDTYFKIAYEKHNLVRARCQIALATDMLRHMDEMNAIIREILNTDR